VRYAFGSYTFDPQRLSLYCHGVALPIKPKTAGLLAYFLQRPGEIVTKAEIMDALWLDADVTEAKDRKSVV
jgi:DNA-binding winged helix-turn-helix (wHTH) protein